MDQVEELERLRLAIRQANTENMRLREALRPFANFAEKFSQQPITNLDDEFYGIHTGTQWEASLRISDCDRALRALKGIAPE